MPETPIPVQHAEMIAMIRTCAANAPESLEMWIQNALTAYEESGAWQFDDLDAYE